jgi:hypothetical protein
MGFFFVPCHAEPLVLFKFCIFIYNLPPPPPPQFLYIIDTFVYVHSPVMPGERYGSVFWG